MSSHKKDPNQIIAAEHDSNLNAKKVKIVGGEMNFSLSADSGDSVQSQSRCEMLELSNNCIFDLSSYCRVKIYAKGGESSVKLYISPEKDGDWFIGPIAECIFETRTGQYQASKEISVMAMRGRIECSEDTKVVLIAKGL